MVQVAYQTGAIAGHVWWAFLGHLLRGVFAMALLMLAIVELVFWCSHRSRWRVERRERQAIKRAATRASRNGL